MNCEALGLDSHKERLIESWSLTCDNKSLNSMLNIVNNRVIQLRDRVIVLSNKTKNKITTTYIYIPYDK